MTAALLFVAVLLIFGVALRLHFTLFRWLYIPASVIAGMIGLAFVQSDFGDWNTYTAAWSDTLQSWPGWLIAVVFAGMLLERKPAPIKESLSRVGRQGLMVWIIVLGQTAVGLLATWLFIQPFYDVPNSFGMLIETGFAGGHGTAAAMGQVYAHPTINLEGGLDLGVLMATVGLVYGVVSGILWINIGVRVGWIEPPNHNVSDSKEPADAQDKKTPIGYATVGGETIDPLLLQMIWLALAFGIGVLMHSLVSNLAGYADQWVKTPENLSAAEQQLKGRMTFSSLLDGFPLFIYTLFGGLFVRQLLRLIGREEAIDRDSINRLTSTAMDILVVAAITSLNLTAVASLIVPVSVLFFCASIWVGVCLLVLAKWILPREHWFQLGLINYGMSTGTTATGFVLLRVVDPELESGAAEDYALAAPLSAPFIGGGMITVGLPLLILEQVPIALVAIVLTAMVIVMIWIGRRWNASSV